MAITLTNFDTIDHSITINLGNGTEVKIRHISDQEMVDLRSFQAGAENAADATGLPIYDTI